MDQKQNDRELIMPAIAARGTVAFPKTTVHLEVGRLKSVLAIEEAIGTNQKIFIVLSIMPKKLLSKKPNPTSKN